MPVESTAVEEHVHPDDDDDELVIADDMLELLEAAAPELDDELLDDDEELLDGWVVDELEGSWLDDCPPADEEELELLDVDAAAVLVDELEAAEVVVELAEWVLLAGSVMDELVVPASCPPEPPPPTPSEFPPQAAAMIAAANAHTVEHFENIDDPFPCACCCLRALRGTRAARVPRRNAC